MVSVNAILTWKRQRGQRNFIKIKNFPVNYWIRGTLFPADTMPVTAGLPTLKNRGNKDNWSI